MIRLDGRHALVTGANRGIGAAIVRALSAAGADVTLLVRDARRAEEVAASLPGRSAIVVADVGDRDAVWQACDDAASRSGTVEILVNNAGFIETAPFLKTEPSLFERMLAVHLMGAVHTSQAVLPGMLERGAGRIVNVSSIAGLRGAPYATAYVAAKHALVGLTRALAEELAPKGIMVNAVCPGYTDTDLVSDAVRRIAAKTGRSASDVLQTIIAAGGQTRLVRPEEVVEVVMRFCDPATEGLTGQAVPLLGEDAT